MFYFILSRYSKLNPQDFLAEEENRATLYLHPETIPKLAMACRDPSASLEEK
jgi:hypothetical protein